MKESPFPLKSNSLKDIALKLQNQHLNSLLQFERAGYRVIDIYVNSTDDLFAFLEKDKSYRLFFAGALTSNIYTEDDILGMLLEIDSR